MTKDYNLRNLEAYLCINLVKNILLFLRSS